MITRAPTLPTFDEMEHDTRWLGYGYLGERRRFLDSEDFESLEWLSRADRLKIIRQVDQLILSYRTWTPAQLFAWANSKDGRHFADVVLDRDASMIKENFDHAARTNLLPRQVW